MLTRADLDRMLDTAVRSGATTLFLLPGREPCLRLQRRLVRSEQGVVGADELSSLIADLAPSSMEPRSGEVAVMHTTAGGIRFAGAVVEDPAGTGLVFRRLPAAIPTLEALGLPELVGSFAELRQGLVLLCGFPGSGRTTTAAALAARALERRGCPLVTLTDRVEWLHDAEHGLAIQRERGRHFVDVPAGIHQAVGQGAEVIVVDPLLDGAALLAALEAVERGCLVLAVVEARDLAAALRQSVDGITALARDGVVERLATCLRAAVSQTLVRKSHGDGRVPLLEILIRNRDVVRVLHERAFDRLGEVMERGRGLGMLSRDRALKDLVHKNQVTMDEAMRHARDREALARA